MCFTIPPNVDTILLSPFYSPSFLLLLSLSLSQEVEMIDTISFKHYRVRKGPVVQQHSSCLCQLIIEFVVVIGDADGN